MSRIIHSLFSTRNLSHIFLWVILGVCCTTSTFAAQLIPKRTWQAREPLLKEIQDFQLKGKVAVQTENNSGSATFDWTQHSERYTISLLGPMGGSGMTLTGRARKVMVTTAKGEHFSAQTPEQLLKKVWGFDLPVSYLKYWIRGLPAPNASAQPTLDRYNRLSSLDQGGWHVFYRNYIVSHGIELPSRIDIESASLKSKIIIYQWHVLGHVLG